MIPYKHINTLFGWLAFSISLGVYALTLEPSVSFWDCGEFISAAYKLQVVHPPGAPLYLMLGRVLSLLAFGNGEQVAFWVNMLSAVSSAFCVLFTFWIITRLACRVLVPNNHIPYTRSQVIIIISAGLVGALSLTFSDTFWFSAVEAEVYATSSFITMLTFWAALKWEENKNTRWLLFIAFITGLSIGVHLLNLLVVPAVVYVVYFGRYKYRFWGFVKTTLAGLGILLFIQYGIIPGLPQLAANADRLAVNSWGLPVGTGIKGFFILSIVLLITLLAVSRAKGKVVLHTALLCLCFVLLGYTSYVMVPIRAAAEPAININRPSDAYSLTSYLKREQYGERAFVYGPYFNAPVKEFLPGKDIIRLQNGQYVKTGQTTKYKYDPEYMTFFPRMGDVFDASSKIGYRGWTGAEGSIPPSFADNLEYFFKYQFLHMYVRYHFWNFAGRQNNRQGHGNALDGNWASGIGVIDNLMNAPENNLYPETERSKARNHYYFLPLILGFIGLFYHAGKSGFVPLFTLFLFTGFLLCVYLNIPPYEPRERDYAFVGSFQVFCVWIGLGVAWLATRLQKISTKAVWPVVIVCFVASPVLLALQNWDDHDRSGRTFVRDYARNYLQSLAPQAVLFVYGDNDTYPLWYAQNVEGIRPDVRIINAHLLNTDWSAYQLAQKIYDSEPLKLSISPQQYAFDKLEMVRVKPGGNGLWKKDSVMALTDVLAFIAADSLPPTAGSRGVFPASKAFLQASEQVATAVEDSSYRVDTWQLAFSSSVVFRAELMMLDIIANNPTRPIYFASLSEAQNLPQLNKYLRLEGLAYRLAPVQYPDSVGYFNRVNTRQQDSLLTTFDLSGYNNPNLYIDPESYATALHYRNLFSLTAEKLLAEGKTLQAARLAKRAIEAFPLQTVPYKYPQPAQVVVKALYLAGKKEEVHTFVEEYASSLMAKVKYYHAIEQGVAAYNAKAEKEKSFTALQNLYNVLQDMGDDHAANEINKFLQRFPNSQ